MRVELIKLAVRGDIGDVENTRGDISPTTPPGWDRTRDLSLCLGKGKTSKAHRIEFSHPSLAQGLLGGILLFSSVFHVHFKSFRKHAGLSVLQKLCFRAELFQL